MTLLLGSAADFDRQMRIGSLEITAALALVALLAARPRIRPAADIGALTPMQVNLEIRERGGRAHTAICGLPSRSAEPKRPISFCTILK